MSAVRFSTIKRASGESVASIITSFFGPANGGNLRDAIFQHAANWCSPRKTAEWSRERDEVVAGRRLSPACYLADAFPASLYLAWTYADNFEGGVISNTNLGGDNCHRGAVAGALMGASLGLSRIPHRFIEGLQVQPNYGGG